MLEDVERLQGAWSFASLEVNGSRVPESAFGGSRMLIEGERFSLTSAGADYAGTFTLDVSRSPKTLDIHFTEGPEAGNTALGIYELDADTWTLCLGLVGSERPREFATRPGSDHALEILRRAGADATVPAETPSIAAAALDPLPPPGELDPELERLQGEWSLVAMEHDGRSMPKEWLPAVRRVMRGRETTVTGGGQVMLKAEIRVDPAQIPGAIDYLLTTGPNKGKTQLGIYAWEGDQVRFCMAEPGKERPADFNAPPGSGRLASLWQRAA
jgi:uncharacterized protein (TIGR03067 family)